MELRRATEEVPRSFIRNQFDSALLDLSPEKSLYPKMRFDLILRILCFFTADPSGGCER